MEAMQTTLLAERPPHVPAELVYDFDLYNVPGGGKDIQAGFATVQQNAPDIFWTPYNGGHWVAIRAEDIVDIQRDYRHFSHREIVVPPFPSPKPPLIPIELDPPTHGDYRRVVVQFLTPPTVASLETRVRDVAIEAIEKLLPAGECEFIRDFSQVLPIVVFFSLIETPMDGKDELLAIADSATRGATAEIRLAGQMQMAQRLGELVNSRRANPGNDLLSKIVTLEIGGQRISEAEAISYGSAIFFGGLDTVAGMLGFIATFLARNPEHRRQLVENLDDEAFIKNAIEELIRRHGLVNTARLITCDYEFKGVQLKEGERILPATPFAGVDERVNPDPLSVDFRRENPVHVVFGNGPHACPGANLARREIRIFLEEWLKRIPNFSIKPGTAPVMATGSVSGVQRLDLVFS